MAMGTLAGVWARFEIAERVPVVEGLVAAGDTTRRGSTQPLSFASRLNRQGRTKLLQTSAPNSEVWNELGHLPPKLPAVVSYSEVQQLMHDDIVNQGWIRHHNSPIEANCAVRAAAAPSLALVTHE